jgi:hypothetical protein
MIALLWLVFVGTSAFVVAWALRALLNWLAGPRDRSTWHDAELEQDRRDWL